MFGDKFRPLLICSVGNPGPKYLNTLHSAGHLLLNQLQKARDFEPFIASGAIAREWSGAVAIPRHWKFSLLKVKEYAPDWATRRYREGKQPQDVWTLWQSRSLMNVSGPGVVKACRQWHREMEELGGAARFGKKGVLVIVQDELEEELGKVRVRKMESSARGHRGIKSIQQCLPKDIPALRIGIGIGRPSSRDPEEVAKYVLSPISKDVEKRLLAGEGDLADKLMDIAYGHMPS